MSFERPKSVVDPPHHFESMDDFYEYTKGLADHHRDRLSKLIEPGLSGLRSELDERLKKMRESGDEAGEYETFLRQTADDFGPLCDQAFSFPADLSDHQASSLKKSVAELDTDFLSTLSERYRELEVLLVSVLENANAKGIDYFADKGGKLKEGMLRDFEEVLVLMRDSEVSLSQMELSKHSYSYAKTKRVENLDKAPEISSNPDVLKRYADHRFNTRSIAAGQDIQTFKNYNDQISENSIDYKIMVDLSEEVLAMANRRATPDSLTEKLMVLIKTFLHSLQNSIAGQRLSMFQTDEDEDGNEVRLLQDYYSPMNQLAMMFDLLKQFARSLQLIRCQRVMLGIK